MAIITAAGQPEETGVQPEKTVNDQAQTQPAVPAAKTPCACAAHKQRMQQYNEAYAEHCVRNAMLTRIVNGLLIVALILMIILYLRQIFSK